MVGTRLRLGSRADWVAMHLVEGTILDVGVRDGYVWKKLKRRPDVAVDIEKWPFVDVLADIHHLPFRDNSFTQVVCTEVLEHVEDPRRGLLECLRVAKDRVIVTVPKGRHESGYAQEYFLKEDEVRELLRGLNCFYRHAETHYWRGYGIVCRKRRS